jgi:trans-2,3-dihydro-3-hydroxyanthranilate isomerase
MSGQRAVKFYQADVFTNTVFGGNPVAVVPEAAGLADREMQKIAREMNLSETVFVLPPSVPGADVRLRFFTPLQEIAFAGHPVLGAFYILAHIGVITLTEPVTRLHQ